jgi:hypothetical protein
MLPRLGWVPCALWISKPSDAYLARTRRAAVGGWQMEKTRENFSAGMPWNRADLFFLSDALARGMSIQELAGFLNRSEDEVRQQAGSRRHDPFSSSGGSPRERHRRSTENKSAFSAVSPVFRAKRRASAARLRHSDVLRFLFHARPLRPKTVPNWLLDSRFRRLPRLQAKLV